MSLLTRKDIEVELGIGVGDDSMNEVLDNLVTAIQSVFEDVLLQRKIEYESSITEYYSPLRYQETLILKRRPITGITSIHEDTDWVYGSSTLISSSDYTYDGDAGIVHYKDWFVGGKRSIKIVYDAGYTSSTFPDGWKQIWIRQAAHWYKDAKNGLWAIKNIGVEGGSATMQILKDNLLPDFVALANSVRG